MNEEQRGVYGWTVTEARELACCVGSDGTHCIANRCAGWRWTTPHDHRGTMRGYCGLAGNVGLWRPVPDEEK